MLTVHKIASRRIENKKENKVKQEESTVYIYDSIGGYYGLNHKEFIENFNKINTDIINLRINSSGGDVFAARAIKTAIMQHKSKVIAHIDGLAASAASFLVLGADEIEIVDGGFFMIHNATSFLDIIGHFNSKDLQDLIDKIRKEKELHEKINQSIANDYAKKTGINIENILELMNNETWFTAKEAFDHKFVDKIYDGEIIEGIYDLSIFAKTPEQIKKRNKKESSFKINIYDQEENQSCIEPEIKKDRTNDLLIRAEILAPTKKI